MPATAMKTVLLTTALLLSFGSARSADAQQTATPATAAAPAASAGTDTLTPAKAVKLSAATDSAVRELERAATELARTVEETVRQTAEDPALRITAMKLASGAVAIAQQALVDNVDMLETMLAEASRQIARAQAAQEAKAAAKKQ